uniref:C-C motif chemokine n=1 Tax=Amphiprion percula TaxID=161767 RepID=A0A3P8TG44_AMPPE
MRTVYMFLLCILGAAMLSTVICDYGIGPDRCCFSYYPRRLKKNAIVSYYMTSHRCLKPGVILLTKTSLIICVDPSFSWVEDIMAHIDQSPTSF